MYSLADQGAGACVAPRGASFAFDRTIRAVMIASGLRCKLTAGVYVLVWPYMYHPLTVAACMALC